MIIGSVCSEGFRKDYFLNNPPIFDSLILLYTVHVPVLFLSFVILMYPPYSQGLIPPSSFGKVFFTFLRKLNLIWIQTLGQISKVSTFWFQQIR